jgi:hypothetical protein
MRANSAGELALAPCAAAGEMPSKLPQTKANAAKNAYDLIMCITSADMEQRGYLFMALVHSASGFTLQGQGGGSDPLTPFERAGRS